MRAFSTKNLTHIALFMVLITLCAWVTVPFAVPMTLQTFGVFLALVCLGGRKGFYAVAGYLLLGLVGVPVFSGFTGGLSAFLNGTGGYLVGFLLAAILYRATERLWKNRLWRQGLCLFLGLLLCYLLGTGWFLLLSKASLSLKQALGICVVPFLGPDVLKLALSLWVGKRLKKLMKL